MEDDLNSFENGRRPQHFENGKRPNFSKMEDDLNFLKWNMIFFLNRKRPIFF